ncbi:MAG: HAF repeat/PEP-CTERM domain-containing protein, partial [Planctomycetota bacterium]
MFKSLLICLSLCLSANLYATSFQGIGDLPGGHVYSVGSMSSDGKTIVGSSSSANGTEAFRWTEAEGMVPLGDLPGAPFDSGATSVSGNGSIIVGQGNLAGNPRAFHYTQDNGMVELPSSATVNDHTFSYFTIATGISTDGSVIVGNANRYTSPGGSGDQPCYWTDGQLHLLTPPGYDSAFGARVEDMSADGSTILINSY